MISWNPNTDQWFIDRYQFFLAISKPMKKDPLQKKKATTMMIMKLSDMLLKRRYLLEENLELDQLIP